MLELLKMIIFGFTQIILEIIKRLSIVLLIIFVAIHKDPHVIKAFGEIFVNILNSNIIIIILIMIIVFLIILFILEALFIKWVFKMKIDKKEEKKNKKKR